MMQVRPYRRHHPAADLVRTETVAGLALPIYRRPQSPDDPWPALKALRRIIGETLPCRVIEAGVGLDTVKAGDEVIDLVSPPATAIAAGFAVRAGTITVETARALCTAIGEEFHG